MFNATLSVRQSAGVVCCCGLFLIRLHSDDHVRLSESVNLSETACCECMRERSLVCCVPNFLVLVWSLSESSM